jgi:hypothetical protein
MADAAMCSPGTAITIKERYPIGGLEAALWGILRPDAPPKATGDVEAHLATLTCATPRWLADQLVELADQLAQSRRRRVVCFVSTMPDGMCLMSKPLKPE